MSPEHWQRIEELCQAALEREVGERSAFLEQACAGDDALRAEVESLLAAYDDDPSFLEEPVAQIVPASEHVAETLVEDMLGRSLRRDEDVGGLEIAVDHQVLVGVVHRSADRLPHLAGHLPRHPAGRPSACYGGHGWPGAGADRRPDEARDLLERAVAIRQEQYGATDVRTAEAHATLGLCLAALGWPADAAALLRESLGILGPEPGADQHLITQARATLNTLDESQTQ